MPKVRIGLRLEDGRGALTITLGDEWATFDAEAIEALIAKLGEKRALMVPRVTKETPQSDVAAPEDPMWVLGRLQNYIMLGIRDPRFGWLRYALSAKCRDDLAGRLKEIAPN